MPEINPLADIPLSQGSITAAGGFTGLQSATFADRFGLALNAKTDFGAKGDNIADDTVALQNALDAMRPYPVPNGSYGENNRPLFIPAGIYKTRRPLYINGGVALHVYGAGMLSTFIMNQGGTADATFTGFITQQSSYHAILTITSAVTNTIYPGAILLGPGRTNLSSAQDSTVATRQIDATHWYIAGGVTVASTAMTATHNSTLMINGVGFSTFERFALRPNAVIPNIGLEFCWDYQAGSAAQLNSFKDMHFSGGWRGCRIGLGAQSDTSQFINCYFGGSSNPGVWDGVGLMVCNPNSHLHQVYGGDFQDNDIGIRAASGYVQSIIGVGFQTHSVNAGGSGVNVWDIQLGAAARDSCFIGGCSTESVNFVQTWPQSSFVTIASCAQRSGSVGTFCDGGGAGIKLINCQSTGGRIKGGASMRLENCMFQQLNWHPDPISAGTELVAQNLVVGDVNLAAGRKYRDLLWTPAGKRLQVEGTSLTDPDVAFDSWNMDLLTPYYPFIDITNASPAVVGFPRSGGNFGFPQLSVNDPVVFTLGPGGALPTGITANTVYYVKTIIDAQQFTISATPGGAAINTTTNYASEIRIWYVRQFSVGDRILNSAPGATGPYGWVCTTAGTSFTSGNFRALT